jgi:hypothetical protein
MCDYSLMSFPNRLAAEGEELVVHRFRSGAQGLVSRSDLRRVAVTSPVRRRSFRSLLSEIGSLLGEIVTGPDNSKSLPAVCIPPGARLLLRDIPERLQSQLGIRGVEEVTFTQLTSDAFSYRDAVHFRNGIEIILQQLQEGQRVRVLNLSSADTASPGLEFLAPAA